MPLGLKTKTSKWTDFAEENDENMATHLVEELYGPFGQAFGNSDNQGLTLRTNDKFSNRKLEPHALNQGKKLYLLKKNSRIQNQVAGYGRKTNRLLKILRCNCRSPSEASMQISIGLVINKVKNYTDAILVKFSKD